jgi:hypothetical protein
MLQLGDKGAAINKKILAELALEVAVGVEIVVQAWI